MAEEAEVEEEYMKDFDVEAVGTSEVESVDGDTEAVEEGCNGVWVVRNS